MYSRPISPFDQDHLAKVPIEIQLVAELETDFRLLPL